MEGHGDVVQLLTEHRALDSCIDKQGYRISLLVPLSLYSLPPSRFLPPWLPFFLSFTPLFMSNQWLIDSSHQLCRLTALHYAVQGGSEQCAQILSNTDYTTHVQDSEGYTPLMRACQNGLTAVTKVRVFKNNIVLWSDVAVSFYTGSITKRNHSFISKLCWCRE